MTIDVGQSLFHLPFEQRDSFMRILSKYRVAFWVHA
jgi:hypothetical protein